jgi:hypothetical protein
MGDDEDSMPPLTSECDSDEDECDSDFVCTNHAAEELIEAQPPPVTNLSVEVQIMVPPPWGTEMPDPEQPDPEPELPNPKLCMTQHPDLHDFALTSNSNNPIT